jgi:hypothetical protein
MARVDEARRDHVTVFREVTSRASDLVKPMSPAFEAAWKLTGVAALATTE